MNASASNSPLTAISTALYRQHQAANLGKIADRTLLDTERIVSTHRNFKTVEKYA